MTKRKSYTKNRRVRSRRGERRKNRNLQQRKKADINLIKKYWGK
jgi:hypothetical protein